MDLKGRSIIVTGGGRGIGLVAARTLLERGARVTICATTEASVATATRELNGGERIAAVAADVSTSEGARAVVAAAQGAFDGVDGVFTNAGLYDEGPLEDTDPAVWDAILSANLSSCFLTIQAALPALRKSGGAIVTMSSFNGATGIPGHVSAYGAAKAAIINLTKSLALDLAPDIRVNCIAPGFVETEKLFARPDSDELIDALGEMTPVGRIGRPEEIAHALVFTFENEFLNGATINIDGGRCAGAGA